MKQRQLGTGGPMVSAIGLGCLSFGGNFGATDTATSLRCLDAAWDHGITFFDTANIYGMGVLESVIGEWLAARKHRPVLATKASIVGGPDRRIDNSDGHLRAELEGSLKRLGADHVDLFYIHRHEEARPIEEVAGTLAAHVADWAGASEIVLMAEDHAAIARILPVGWAYGDRYNDDQAAAAERYC